MAVFRSNALTSSNHSSGRRSHTPIKDDFESPSSSPPNRSYISSNQTMHTTNTTDASSIVPITSTLQNGSSSENTPRKENSAPSTSSSSETLIVSADTTVKQIQADKSEAQHVIATYGVDPMELLHMGKFPFERRSIIMLIDESSLALREKNKKKEVGHPPEFLVIYLHL